MTDEEYAFYKPSQDEWVTIMLSNSQSIPRHFIMIDEVHMLTELSTEQIRRIQNKNNIEKNTMEYNIQELD